MTDWSKYAPAPVPYDPANDDAEFQRGLGKLPASQPQPGPQLSDDEEFQRALGQSGVDGSKVGTDPPPSHSGVATDWSKIGTDSPSANPTAQDYAASRGSASPLMTADGFIASAEHFSAPSDINPQSPQGAPEPLKHATSARRMRIHRARRQKGLRCLTVELREREVEALVAKKLLPSGSRSDNTAIRKALYAYLDGTLGRSL